MSNLQDTIKNLLTEALSVEQKAELAASIADTEKRFGAGKTSLGASIRKISGNSTQAAHGSDNFRKYVNADGSLTPAAVKLNTQYRLDNPHEPAGRGHPIVGGAMYQHKNTQGIANTNSVIKKAKK